MPYKCCVPNCGSNYDSTHSEHITVFSFPTNEDQRKKWISAIPRRDWTVTKHTRVCIKHFEENEIEYCETYIDKTLIEKKWTKPKPSLKPGAIPRIFPGCSSYLNKNSLFIRQNPDERNKRRKENEEQRLKKIADKDIIKSFQDFKDNFNLKVKVIQEFKYQCYVCENVVVFYQMNCDNYPKVTYSIKILPNLTVLLFREEFFLNISDVSKVIPKTGVFTKWSEISQLLGELHSYVKEKEKEDELSICLNQIMALCKNIKELFNKDFTHPLEEKIKFLADQFLLLQSIKKNYSVDTIILSFIIHTQSSAAYDSLRENNCLTLPHPSWLKRLSSSFFIDAKNESSNKHFLSFMGERLTTLEKYVVLTLDEIYVKEAITYKNGQLSGQADNDVNEPAKTIQTFMIHSAFGNFKEVVALIPVKKQNGDILTDLTKKVIKVVQECGFQVIVIISDNNRINQSLFNNLSDSTGFQMNNPFFQDQPIFLMYDPVHIFKNVRNNWLNQKDVDKTFLFPDFNNVKTNCNESVCVVKEACFSDLRKLYAIEANLLVKRAYKLNYKSLYPTNLERQKVILVDNIFHDSTISALLTVSTDHYTAEFLIIIHKWWNIVNNKNTLKGIIKKNDLCLPFTDINDERFEFFDQFLQWLNIWKNLNLNGGHLTNDTFQALYQTTFVITNVIKYALQKLKVPYVLVGKLQSDYLEKRFGRYRQMSGCSYNVTVTQVLEAEKKLRIKSVLGIHSARYGMVKYKDNIFNSDIEFDEIPEHCETENALNHVLTEDYLSIQTDNAVLIYIAGYAAHKICSKQQCQQCKTILRENKGCPINDEYFDYLQRGGLSVPTDIILNICNHVIALMSCLISEKYESQFLQQTSQKAVLKMLTRKSITGDPFLNEFLEETCGCGKKY